MQTLVDVQAVNLNITGRQILENINFTIKIGEIVTVIGPNGAGKTALLRVILGLNKATSGQIVKKDNLRIGYMPQALNLESLMPITAERFLWLSPRADKAKCAKVIEELKIGSLLKYPMQTLSGGETQRVLLARALLNEPELLVLDEPAQGVDVNGQAELYKLISDIRKRINCAIIMVSHDLHLVISGTDKVICLNRHICCYGSPDSITKNPHFIELFGNKIANELALYTHHHDHSHDNR